MATRRQSSGDRHDRGATSSASPASTRRKTVSGPMPQHMNITEEMRFPWSSPSAPTSPRSDESQTLPSPKSISYKRNTPSNLLSRFGFLRSGGDDGGLPSPHKDERRSFDRAPKSPTKSIFGRKSTEDETQVQPPISPTKGENVMAAVLKAGKTRKRKGSLRKTALLGTRRNEGRERRGSFSVLNRPQLGKQHPQDLEPETNQEEDPTAATEHDVTVVAAPAPYPPQPSRDLYNYERPHTASSSDSSWSGMQPMAAARLSLITDQKARLQQAASARSTVSDLGSPLEIISPESQKSYISTTDDDDVLTFRRPVKPFPSQSNPVSNLSPALPSTATGYFPTPSESSLSMRPRRPAQRSSPLSHSVPMTGYAVEPEGHDYTETEYWGWVILFVTWLIFTVGMGSCLGIWSWAWDVGKTPYAPPELEDDATLPIVGYYPALIVLTGVVAWVWITVAWVGMKYFRHAKIEV